jgi:hypothetical protein
MRKFTWVLVITIATLFFSVVLPEWRKHENKAANVVKRMDDCVSSEKQKGVGQDHLDSVYRICWMRAQRNTN